MKHKKTPASLPTNPTIPTPTRKTPVAFRLIL